MKSIPSGRQPSEGGPEDTPQDWSRFPGGVKPADFDDEDVFDRPGDVQSIPRDGKPADKDAPVHDWSVPDEDIPFHSTSWVI